MPLGKEADVELVLALVVVVVDVAGVLELLGASDQRGRRLFEDVDVGVTDVDADVRAVASGPGLGFEGDLGHAGQVPEQTRNEA